MKKCLNPIILSIFFFFIFVCTTINFVFAETISVGTTGSVFANSNFTLSYSGATSGACYYIKIKNSSGNYLPYRDGDNIGRCTKPIAGENVIVSSRLSQSGTILIEGGVPAGSYSIEFYRQDCDGGFGSICQAFQTAKTSVTAIDTGLPTPTTNPLNVSPSPTPRPGETGQINLAPPCAGGRCNIAIGSFDVDNVGKFISQLFAFCLAIAGAAAVLLIIYSGFILMTSAGNKERIQGARETLVSAIAGLIFILLSLGILSFIAKNVLNIPEFK